MVGDSVSDLEAAQFVGTLFYGRGNWFSNLECPWGEDLTGLDQYLKKAEYGIDD